MNDTTIPGHLAIIMDGNGRWAESQGLPRTAGHRKGADSVRTIVRACRSRGVKHLTLYAFSVANWRRPALEVQALMRLLAHFADQEKAELLAQDIRLDTIGQLADLPKGARRALERTMTATADCQEMVLSLALSYGGRNDIARAARALAEQVKSGALAPEDVNESSLQAAMSTSRLPPVDLLIRTGGESRVSDFLLYEAAYAELMFVPEMWPDFGEAELDAAFRVFGGAERRFGLTSSQIAGRPQGKLSRLQGLAFAAH